MAITTRHPLCTNEGTHYQHTFPFETESGTVRVTCEGVDPRAKTVDIASNALASVEKALKAIGATIVDKSPTPEPAGTPASRSGPDLGGWVTAAHREPDTQPPCTTGNKVEPRTACSRVARDADRVPVLPAHDNERMAVRTPHCPTIRYASHLLSSTRPAGVMDYNRGKRSSDGDAGGPPTPSSLSPSQRCQSGLDQYLTESLTSPHT